MLSVFKSYTITHTEERVSGAKINSLAALAICNSDSFGAPHTPEPKKVANTALVHLVTPPQSRNALCALGYYPRTKRYTWEWASERARVGKLVAAVAVLTCACLRSLKTSALDQWNRRRIVCRDKSRRQTTALLAVCRRRRKFISRLNTAEIDPWVDDRGNLGARTTVRHSRGWERRVLQPD